MPQAPVNQRLHGVYYLTIDDGNIGIVDINEKGVSFMKAVSIVFSKLQFKLPIDSLGYRHF